MVNIREKTLQNHAVRGTSFGTIWVATPAYCMPGNIGLSIYGFLWILMALHMAQSRVNDGNDKMIKFTYFLYQNSSFTLPETNIFPENRPSQ